MNLERTSLGTKILSPTEVARGAARHGAACANYAISFQFATAKTPRGPGPGRVKQGARGCGVRGAGGGERGDTGGGY